MKRPDSGPETREESATEGGTNQSISEILGDFSRWVELFRASYAWLRESLPRPLAVREFERSAQQERRPKLQRPGLSDRDHRRDG